VEARALIEEARKADPSHPGAFVAEALQLDRDDKNDEARAAYIKAAELGTSHAYALYRAAVMQWGTTGRPTQDTLRQMEKHLARATELNPFFASAHASLGEVRAALGVPVAEAVAPLEKAVQLEPSDPWHRLAAARVLWRYDNLADARKAAQVALTLADSDQERTAAQRLLSEIPTASARPPAAPPASSPPSAGSTPDPNALVASCQRGDVAACRDLAPIAEKACAGGQQRACLLMAVMQMRGDGVTKDEARALATFEQLCNGGLPDSCTQWAVILASHPQKPDIAKARQLLTKSCDGGFAPACEVLKSMPK
jgi:TPR repeat protein